MNKLQLISLCGLGIVALYQVWVSFAIYHAEEYDVRQRWFQLLLIWLVPFFGALGCHLFLTQGRAEEPRADLKFTPQPPNDAGSMD